MGQKHSAVTTRRRPNELERAIYDATLTQLKAAGYDGVTMENIAARARCSKGSLYRRWPGKHALIHAALRSQLPPISTAPRGGTARQELFSVLNSFAKVLTGNASYPELVVMVGLFGDAEIRAIYDELVVGRTVTMLERIILAGICSAEIDAAAVTTLATRMGTALIVQHVLLTQSAPTASEIRRIIDTMIGQP
ncbi:TetR/AcrR family transcriptional regulator [Mycobacterium sp. 1245852.3]|uniref:TetR/AcrR family transcriptional regulator n=1 Tax=Mycobacterium sp. 1245852.3 TaxID=1856860 RepID=UPI0007FE5568|nr:TetR/AcrR family transcriptional regulator [Mycobacterium sp. 1245852.3]OBJ83278.1 hypothetical protein A9W96_27825 [Mycobacterium sp. 1245852.3]